MADEALLREFFEETTANMARADLCLKTLKADPADAAAADDLFRAFHTLAGTCGFFGFDNLGRLGRAAEKLATAWRDGLLKSTAEAHAALAAARAAVARRLEDMKRGTAADDDGEDPALAKLERALAGGN